jgi:hypothetical protein
MVSAKNDSHSFKMHLNGELDNAKKEYEVELTKSRNIAIDQKSKVYRMQ